MNEGPVLGRGAWGEDVRRLQRLLVMLGELRHDAITGALDDRTDRAVRSFQARTGLPIDGEVGEATWSALPSDPATPELRRGSEGYEVAALQTGLCDAGGPGEDTDPGAADGFFGEHTETAVRAYQTARSLEVDGVVGDRTWWVPADDSGATLASLSGLTSVGGDRPQEGR